MCIENKEDLTEDEKKEHIKKQIDRYNKEEVDDILEACKNIKDIKDFVVEVALLKNDFKHLKEDLDSEIRDREKSMREFKVNYVDRFNQLNTETKKNRSKIGDMHLVLSKKIEAIENQISGLFLSVTDTIENTIKEKINSFKEFFSDDFKCFQENMQSNTDLKIQNETNKVYKIIIKFGWGLIGIIIIGFLSFWVKEFIQYMGWVKP